jgi:O-antigen ligase
MGAVVANGGRRWLRWLLLIGCAIMAGAAAVVKAIGLTHWTWLAVVAVAVGALAALPSKLLLGHLEQASGDQKRGARFSRKARTPSA